MKFKGKFVDASGDHVYGWFEAPNEEVLRTHLEEKGWKVLAVQRGWKPRLERPLRRNLTSFLILGALLGLVSFFIYFKIGWLPQAPLWLKKSWQVFLLGVGVALFTLWFRLLVKDAVKDALREMAMEEGHWLKSLSGETGEGPARGENG
ncbi:MAG: hypothetical protein HY714_00355 [Candidatus Omnitrophica bacterium]|nr:hypothetical protein [Candidatus Omnitrophota bacterium]